MNKDKGKISFPDRNAKGHGVNRVPLPTLVEITGCSSSMACPPNRSVTLLLAEGKPHVQRRDSEFFQKIPN